MSAVLRPIGPQPPKVYWLRRAVVLLAAALVVALIVWAWPSGDDGDPTAANGNGVEQTPGDSDGDGSKSEPDPDATITGEPGGPRDDGSQYPDDEDGGSDGGSGGGSDEDEGSGAAGSGSDDADSAGGGSGGAGGSGSGQKGSGGAGRGGSADDDGSSDDLGGSSDSSGEDDSDDRGDSQPQRHVCSEDALQVEADTTRGTVKAGSDVAAVVTIENTGTTACRMQVQPDSLQVRILSGSDQIWDSDDCPASIRRGPLTLEPDKPRAVSLTWPGIRSTEGCPSKGDTDAVDVAEAGYYLIEARIGDLVSPAGRFRLV